MDIASATKADFEPFINDEFTVGIDDRHSESMNLIDVSGYLETTTRGMPREAFSVLFQGPVGPIHPQRMYDFHHTDLGDFSLFLVPIREDAEGVVYQSIVA